MKAVNILSFALGKCHALRGCNCFVKQIGLFNEINGDAAAHKADRHFQRFSIYRNTLIDTVVSFCDGVNH